MKKYLYLLAAVVLCLCHITTGYSHTSEELIQPLPSGGGSATADSILFNSFLTLNKAYRTNDSVLFKGLKKLFTETASSQHPKAFVLDCIDSRVIPELAFQQTIGKIFTGRAAGNMMAGDITGSLSYAVNFKGVTCIVVLGHANCGAVGGAVDYYNGTFDTVKAGPQLTAILARIATHAVRPTIAADKDGKLKPYVSTNAKFVDAVAQTNVTYTATEVNRTFNTQGIHVFKAFYNTADGKVTQLR